MTAHPSLRGDVAVLVPAAGSGVRLGPGAPKALRPLRGDPLLVHAVRRILAAPSVGCVVVAAPPDAVADVTALLAPLMIPVSPTAVASAPAEIIVVAGGVTRQASVGAALAAVPARYGIVLVHDAARAMTPSLLFERVSTAIRGGHAAVIPVLPVIDTIKQVDVAGDVLGTVDRSALRAVQTPQGFRRSVLEAAHRAAVDELTDDAGLAEKIGITVHTVPGDEAALKITRPFDLAIAELFLDS